MRRFTTPTITLLVEGVDLTEMDVRVTFKQGRRKLTIQHPTVEIVTIEQTEYTKVTVTLTQEQTGYFADSPCKVQVNWIAADGSRDATEIKATPNWPNLLDEVVDYEL